MSGCIRSEISHCPILEEGADGSVTVTGSRPGPCVYFDSRVEGCRDLLVIILNLHMLQKHHHDFLGFFFKAEPSTDQSADSPAVVGGGEAEAPPENEGGLDDVADVVGNDVDGGQEQPPAGAPTPHHVPPRVPGGGVEVGGATVAIWQHPLFWLVLVALLAFGLYCLSQNEDFSLYMRARWRSFVQRLDGGRTQTSVEVDIEASLSTGRSAENVAAVATSTADLATEAEEDEEEEEEDFADAKSQISTSTIKTSSEVLALEFESRPQLEVVGTETGTQTAFAIENEKSSKAIQVATPTKATPAKKTPAKATPVKATPAKKTPAKTTPTKATPTKKTPAKATPAKKTPAKATPTKTPAKAEK